MSKLDELVKEMTLEEKVSLLTGNGFWHTKAIERLGISPVMMSDGPAGLRKQIDTEDNLGVNESVKAVGFPCAAAIASSFDTELAGELGETLGDECLAEDVSLLLGPGVNIKRSPLCGRNFEYYSEDPYLAGKMGAAYVKGLQSKGIGACVKHFALNNQETRRMGSNSQADEKTIHEIYLTPFEMIIKEAKPWGIMCAYNAINGEHCAENRWLLRETLKDKWGHEGFVVTDWGAAKGKKKGLLAGLDLEMPGSQRGEDGAKAIAEAVRSGELDEEVLNDAVERLLSFILKAQDNRRKGVYDKKTDYQKAVRFAQNSAVLLKNEGNILPLKEGDKIAFIGSFIDRPRYQGSGSSFVNSEYVPSVKELIKDNPNIVTVRGFNEDGIADETLENEALKLAERSACVVVFAGLTDREESEGFDRVSMDMPKNQNRLIEKLSEVNNNVIVVLHNGAPVTMPWADKVSAILEMYLGGDGVSQATLDLLFGKVSPSGKLAESFPVKLEDNPSYLNFPGYDGSPQYREGIFVGYRYYDKKKMEVLFPFGHGLSYSTFEYSDLKINKTESNQTETVSVSCVVRNTGSCRAKEVVQLYVSSEISSINRPVKELKGFNKIELDAGEEERVDFLLDRRAFAYYEVKVHDFFVESGEYTIRIGSSSRDIRLEERISIRSNDELPVTFTAMSTLGDLMKTEKGRNFVRMLTSQAGANTGSDNMSATGEGSAEAMQKMMVEIPLATVASFAGMTDEQLDEILEMLNDREGE